MSCADTPREDPEFNRTSLWPTWAFDFLGPLYSRSFSSTVRSEMTEDEGATLITRIAATEEAHQVPTHPHTALVPL